MNQLTRPLQFTISNKVISDRGHLEGYLAMRAGLSVLVVSFVKSDAFLASNLPFQVLKANSRRWSVWRLQLYILFTQLCKSSGDAVLKRKNILLLRFFLATSISSQDWCADCLAPCNIIAIRWRASLTLCLHHPLASITEKPGICSFPHYSGRPAQGAHLDRIFKPENMCFLFKSCL